MALLTRPHTQPSNAQLAAVLDTVDELLLLLDARQRVSWCNQAAQRLLGCETGLPLADALPGLDDDSQRAVLAALNRGPSAQTMTLPVRRTQGDLLTLSLATLPGGARSLRAPTRPAALPLPPLPPGATSDLVQMLWDSRLPLTVQDSQFRLVAANRAYFDTFGQWPARVLGQDPINLVPPEDRQRLLAERQQLQAAMAAGQAHGLALTLERRLVDAQGRERWFRLAPRWVTSDDGAPLLLAILQDVTQALGTQQHDERSGHELDQWFDLSPLGMLVYDAAGRVLRSNAAFVALVGGALVQLQDAPADVCQLLAWQDGAPHPDLTVDAPALEVRSQVSVAPGLHRRLSARLRAFVGDGGPLRVMAVVQDLSLQDEHDLAQLEIATLMNTAGMGVATYEASRGWLGSRQGRLARHNGAGSDRTSASTDRAGASTDRTSASTDRTSAGSDPASASSDRASALLNRTGAGPDGNGAGSGRDAAQGLAALGTAGAAQAANDAGLPAPAAGRSGLGAAGSSGLPSALQAIGRDQVDPGSRAEFERLQRALRDGQRVQVRYLVHAPELGPRWLLTRVEPGELTGGRPALSVVTLDVTEQEEAHRRNEQLLRELSTILDGTTAGIAYLRGERLVRCNRRFEALMDLPVGRAAGVLVGDLLADQPEALALLRRALAEDGRHEIELAHPGAEGQPGWLALSVSRAPGAEQPELVVVLTDITRLKAQQLQLEALARERELMFTLSDVGVAYQRQGRIERANQALAQLTGYSVDELSRMHPAMLFEDEGTYALLHQQQQIALRTTGLWRGERRLRRRDGRAIWVQVSKRRVDLGDALAGVICSYVDVDERRRAREALQLQAERTRAILDSVLVGIVTVGDGGIEWMNRSARRMFGGELADFVGEPIAIVATADPDHPLRATHYRQALGDGQSETFECKLRGRDGREFWVVGNAVVTGRGESSASQITFALLDIERRRQAEVSIAQAQASLQRIIETAPLAIALFDAASGRVLRLNQMAAMFFGRPVEAVLGRPPEDWFSPEDAASLRADLDGALNRPDVLRRELPRPSRADGDGEVRVWDMRVVSLDATGGQPQLLLVASDVTEQRAAEQARFEAAVSQREMLVKEVHHRIKNNLQGVAGLLQQTAARRPEVAALISEAVGQVQAIAQVHGLQVGASGPLRIRPLIEAITASVQRTFGRAITVVVQGMPSHRFALPEGESIPIALTINELLTNAIKHSTPGEVRCELHCDEARLTVAIYNPGQLRGGFSLAQVPPGVSGLGLVRALLPRRTATLTLLQAGHEVEAKVVLVPPGITLLEPL